MRVQYPGNPPQSHRWALNPSALRVVHGHNVGDQVMRMIVMMIMMMAVMMIMITMMLMMIMMAGQDIRGPGQGVEISEHQRPGECARMSGGDQADPLGDQLCHRLRRGQGDLYEIIHNA